MDVAPGMVDHVPSPRKNVVLDGVPVTGFAAMFVTVEIKYPEVGIVNVVSAVAVSVVLNAPDVVKLPPRVMVFVPLLTPVPPYVEPTKPDVICVPAIAIVVLLAAVNCP
jgi:hypothetical protein